MSGSAKFISSVSYISLYVSIVQEDGCVDARWLCIVVTWDFYFKASL